MRERDELFIPYGRRTGPGGGPRVDLRVVVFFCTVLVLLGLAGWLYLRQSSEVAQLASAIGERELRKEALHREIVVLNAEVAMLGSLKRVLHEGIEMGYELRDAGDSVASVTVDCPGCRTLDAPVAQAWTGPTPSLRTDPSGAWQGMLDRLGAWLRPWLSESAP